MQGIKGTLIAYTHTHLPKQTTVLWFVNSPRLDHITGMRGTTETERRGGSVFTTRRGGSSAGTVNTLGQLVAALNPVNRKGVYQG